MKKLLLAAALLAGTSSLAFAADVIVEETIPDAVVVDVFSWTGAYVGAHIGYGWGEANAVDTDADGGFFDEDEGEEFSVDTEGVIGGIQVGYNWQMNNFVFGIEGDLGYLGVDGDEFAEDEPDNFGDVEYGFYGDLTARAGVAADRVLIYGKGGVAFADIEYSFGDVIDGTDEIDEFSNATEDDFEVGYTVGGGVEYAFTNNWTAKIEYQYFDFGDADLEDVQDDTAEVELDLHTVKFGINYKF